MCGFSIAKVHNVVVKRAQEHQQIIRPTDCVAWITFKEHTIVCIHGNCALSKCGFDKITTTEWHGRSKGKRKETQRENGGHAIEKFY